MANNLSLFFEPKNKKNITEMLLTIFNVYNFKISIIQCMGVFSLCKSVSKLGFLSDLYLIFTYFISTTVPD